VEKLSIKANLLNLNEKKESYLVLTLLLVSGNPFIDFLFGWEPVLIVISIYLALRLKQSNRLILENKGLIIFFTFIALFTLQIVYFSFLPLMTIIGFLLRLFIGYAIIRLVSNFPRLYVFIVLKLCFLSLVFWGLSRTGLFDYVITMLPKIHEYEWSGIASHSLGFHTFYMSPETGSLRNAGLFWEPGAFAGYIIVAMIFLALARKQYTAKSYKICQVVFTFTIITTMSSAGYLLLPFVFILNYDFTTKKHKNKYQPIALFMVVVILGTFLVMFVFKNVDFLQKKTSGQLDKTMMMSEYDLAYNNTRFGTLMFDWYYIKKSPFFGNGLHEFTRYRDHGENRVSGQGNGLSDFVAKFGFFGFFGFTYFLYIGLKSNFGNSKKIVVAILVMFASLSAEPYLTYPLYLSFMFLNCNRKFSYDVNRYMKC